VQYEYEPAMFSNYLQQLSEFRCGHPALMKWTVTLDASTQTARERVQYNDANVTG